VEPATEPKEMRWAEEPEDLRPPGPLREDFRVFLDPAFLVVLGIIALAWAAGAGLLVWASTKYGIAPF
jgi:hypothetical protein